MTPLSLDHLKTRLDNYVRQLNIVRVLRQRERKGLTAARLMGAQAAQGEVLTFLDSHCMYPIMQCLPLFSCRVQVVILNRCLLIKIMKVVPKMSIWWCVFLEVRCTVEVNGGKGTSKKTIGWSTVTTVFTD